MAKITITVDVDGNAVSREYDILSANDTVEVWGERVVDILDTIDKSNKIEF